jgi:hypothetical protein
MDKGLHMTANEGETWSHIAVVRDFGTTVEVSAGVKDGDQVILNPPVDLTDGRKVNVRPGPQAQLAAKKLRDGSAEFDLVIVEGNDGPKI